MSEHGEPAVGDAVLMLGNAFCRGRTWLGVIVEAGRRRSTRLPPGETRWGARIRYTERSPRDGAERTRETTTPLLEQFAWDGSRGHWRIQLR